MVLVHQRLTEGDKNWGCATVGNGDNRIDFAPYTDCNQVETTTSFTFVYDQVLQKQGMAVDFGVSCFNLITNFYLMYLTDVSIFFEQSIIFHDNYL